MLKRVGCFLLSLLMLSSCDSIKSKGNAADLSVAFGITSESPLVNSNELDIKFGNASSGSNDLAEFISSKRMKGWSRSFNFPPSSILTGTACQSPNLIGFVDIHISEGPNVSKYIDLLEGVELEVQVFEPGHKQYQLKEFDLMPNSEFGIYFNGERQSILNICTVRFSHFPERDFARDFELEGGRIVMKDDSLSSFDLYLDRSGVDMTEITIMGVARVDGQRVGFTASTEIEVGFEETVR